MACRKRSELAGRGNCLQFTQPQRQLISAPPRTSRRSARTGTKNRFGLSALSRLEPPRVCRRLFGLGHAAMARSSAWA
jgi:hypothetical protein